MLVIMQPMERSESQNCVQPHCETQRCDDRGCRRSLRRAQKQQDDLLPSPLLSPPLCSSALRRCASRGPAEERVLWRRPVEPAIFRRWRQPSRVAFSRAPSCPPGHRRDRQGAPGCASRPSRSYLLLPVQRRSHSFFRDDPSFSVRERQPARCPESPRSSISFGFRLVSLQIGSYKPTIGKLSSILGPLL